MSGAPVRGAVVEVDGDSWIVIAVGATEGDSTYLHLASRTRFIAQRNGRRAIQSCGWYRAGENELWSEP